MANTYNVSEFLCVVPQQHHLPVGAFLANRSMATNKCMSNPARYSNASTYTTTTNKCMSNPARYCNASTYTTTTTNKCTMSNPARYYRAATSTTTTTTTTNKYMSNPAGTAMYQHTSLHFLLVRTNPIPHRSTVGAKV